MSSFEAAIPFPSAEMREKPDNIFKKILNKIKSVRDAIVSKFHARGNKLAQMTDDALVDVAKETIADADSDGRRSEEESASIMEAVETVVVQGAMEEAGAAEATRENPILRLKRDESVASDLDAAITDLNEHDVALPTGEKVADLADTVIERAEIADAPRVNLSETIQNFMEKERSSESNFRARTEIICDRDHIENQRIDIVDKQDKGAIEFSFKLRNSNLDFSNLATASGTPVRKGFISYEDKNNGRTHGLSEAFVFQKDGLKVSVASPNTEVRTAMGLVKIEAPADMQADKIEEVMANIFTEDLQVPDALNDVSEKSENLYKASMYVWHNKLDGQLTPEQAEKAEKLQRKEVFPGYSTFVDEGRHEEYLSKYGDLRAVHHLNGGDASEIFKVLREGLLSSSERYARGVFREGMSTLEDFQEGGADSVFTRILTKEWREKKHGSFVIFKPELFDRTDWYSYKNDRFGSTDEEIFKHRLSPDELMGKIANDKDYMYRSNEQMFRTGIGASYIEAIEVDDITRGQIISELRKMGLTEFDGRPIESVIIARHQKETERPVEPPKPEAAQPTQEELDWMMYGYGNQPIEFPELDKDNDKKEA